MDTMKYDGDMLKSEFDLIMDSLGLGTHTRAHVRAHAGAPPGNIGYHADKDPAVQPSHYHQFKIEPIRFGVENYGRGILVTKIVKYIQRAPFKNGAQDMAKAARCLEMLTKFDAGDQDWWKRTGGQAEEKSNG